MLGCDCCNHAPKLLLPPPLLLAPLLLPPGARTDVLLLLLLLGLLLLGWLMLLLALLLRPSPSMLLSLRSRSRSRACSSISSRALQQSRGADQMSQPFSITSSKHTRRTRPNKVVIFLQGWSKQYSAPHASCRVGPVATCAATCADALLLF
jgi:hypothetical protein